MATKKITKKEMFNQILAKLVDEEERAFIEHEIELLERKNSKDRKPTAKQLENEGLKTAIYEGMLPNTYYTITEIGKKVVECNELSNQKISALVSQLVEAQMLIRVEEKRKAYFCKVCQS